MPASISMFPNCMDTEDSTSAYMEGMGLMSFKVIIIFVEL